MRLPSYRAPSLLQLPCFTPRLHPYPRPGGQRLRAKFRASHTAVNKALLTHSSIHLCIHPHFVCCFCTVTAELSSATETVRSLKYSFSVTEKEPTLISDPLQDSCLENLTDGEAWLAAVYGVAQSQTEVTQQQLIRERK